MNKTLWQKLQPHVLAIGIFFIIAVIYCLPAIQGKVVNQSDVVGWKGMAQQSFEFKEKHGHFPLWTNSLFGGMPAYQVAMESKYNVTIAWLDYLFRGFLPTPAGLFFLSCVCFYILCVVFRLRTWVGIFGSLAYAFASYSPILAEVGHTTKLAAMGYTPGVVAGFILLLQRKYLLGFITTMLFATLLLYQNHIQIAYYTILLLLCIGVAYLIHAIRQKQIKPLLIAGLLALTAGGIAGASYAVMLMPLQEYAKETMRGGRSELTLNKPKGDQSKGGLDKEYAFRWSYGIGESMSFVLPAARGGSSSAAELGDKSKVIEAMQDVQLPDQAISYFAQFMSPYWGEQPNTSGPVYFGVIVIMLSITGLFLVKGWHKGWLIAATVLGILMAWGSNLSGFNYFLFDYLPLYNKFRAPSMSLVIPQLTLALLASLALQEILYSNSDQPTIWKKLKPAAIITGLVAVLMIGTYFTADFKSTKDKPLQQNITQMLSNGYAQGKQPNEQIIQKANGDASVIVRGLVEDRKSAFGKDLFRSLLFLAIGIGLVYLAVKKKLQAQYLAIAFAVISFIDLIGVDLRYLNNKKYIAEDELLGTYFTPNSADQQIKQDTGYYRVLDQTENFANDSRSAYFHNSVGGYHPAKLALYQDLLENQLGKNNMQVLNMLNTKYMIIANPQTQQPMALPNPDACGPVWFVKGIRVVNNADEEMLALDSLPVKDSAVIDKREQSKLGAAPQYDSSATIRLVENVNDYIKYESKSATPQFAVFSEIYYPYGWKASIDGKEVPIARVNYALRGVSIPAGSHTIEFRFEPQVVKTGDLISLIIGVISWLILVAGLFFELKKVNKQTA